MSWSWSILQDKAKSREEIDLPPSYSDYEDEEEEEESDQEHTEMSSSVTAVKWRHNLHSFWYKNKFVFIETSYWWQMLANLVWIHMELRRKNELKGIRLEMPKKISHYEV